MKIQSILSEDIGAAVAYKQLSALQIGLLRKIVDHRFDYDSSSPQSQDAVNSLIDLGLVDSMTIEPTDRGVAALELAKKYGSTERRQLDQSKVAPQSQSVLPDDDGTVVPDDEFEIN